eukprot:PhF_6_TR17115/c1_g1_i1/m.26394
MVIKYVQGWLGCMKKTNKKTTTALHVYMDKRCFSFFCLLFVVHCVGAVVIANFSNLSLGGLPKNGIQKVPLLRHFGFKSTTFFVRKDGFFLKEDKITFWGARARILEQYYTRTNNNPGRTSNVTCGYIDVDTSNDLSKYFVRKSPSPQPGMYLRMLLGYNPDLDIHYELMMNLSLFVRHDDPHCRDVVGFNVSWNLEYTFSLFSLKYARFVASSDENWTYSEYLINETTYVKLIQKPLFFPNDNDVFDRDNYDITNPSLPRGWLCGRGLGNGTWIWECGPEEGKPFTFTKWAPGEPTLLDGCLYVNSTSDIPPNVKG